MSCSNTCTVILVTVPWALMDFDELSLERERGEWEFEKLNKITQYRHNINTSIKKRVILSFDNVSCSLSDTWFADKRKNIYFYTSNQYFFSFLIWRFYDFWFFSIQIGSPAFLKITFQLHRNPTVLIIFIYIRDV